MRPFEIHFADTPSHALGLLAAHRDAKLLAGGTTLVDLMKHDIERPLHVIDIHRIGLDQVEVDFEGVVHVGAMVRNAALAVHPEIRRRYPVLSQALLAGASPQLRNMATTAGNLLQRTRCLYFRDIAGACNKREPGSGCGAWDGLNRNNAVIGGSERCIATNPSDMTVALVALDAVVRVMGLDGERRIPVADLYVDPADDPSRETVLTPHELILGVDLPPLLFATRSAYVKARDRQSYAFALASAAVALDVEGDTVRDARIALGGVATRPMRYAAAESALRGERVGPTTFARAAAAAMDDARPRRHNAFKIELAKRTLVRALERAMETR